MTSLNHSEYFSLTQWEGRDSFLWGSGLRSLGWPDGEVHNVILE